MDDVIIAQYIHTWSVKNVLGISGVIVVDNKIHKGGTVFRNKNILEVIRYIEDSSRHRNYVFIMTNGVNL